jgi:hypothetical protein
MANRNDNRDILLNQHSLYHKLLKSRGRESFRHYGRKSLRSISPENISELTIADHIWKTGDSLYKLAQEYYSDIQYWWVIGWFNMKPADTLYKAGDLVHIPLPLEEVLYYIESEDG